MLSAAGFLVAFASPSNELISYDAGEAEPAVLIV